MRLQRCLYFSKRWYAAPLTQVSFKTWAPFVKCFTQIDGATTYDAEDLELAMPMHNLIEHSSSYSEAAGTLWCYSKAVATDFDNNIANTDDFKYFIYKLKL